ncbi:chloride channel protein [Sediminitomix flava]|uniref:CIC family chloride channel protein n=1 Tax=Sediminitomix flava TaxID=379075 RepID=A0A315ZIP3_SEDFL|nr:chloride channel protein [Sediminitomix flava]PWJ45083.1 CIC family chloride channel protein [Sediminitomix flava]
MGSYLSALDRVLNWRRRHLSDNSFTLFTSAIIGILSGLAAVILKETVHMIHTYLTTDSYDENYFQLTYPIIGILATVAIAKLLYRGPVKHAISHILYAIARQKSVIGKSKMYTYMVTSAFTVGFGGSVGLESPIVLTGSAIGSNIARWFHMDTKKRTLMIGCGTAGVISAIFNAPIAGMIFSTEIILTGITISNFTPLLIASVSATLVSILTLGDDVLFSFRLVEDFVADDVIYFIGLGIVCGFTSLYFNYALHRTETYIHQKKFNPYVKALVGGSILSALIFFTPPVFGEGYPYIMALLNGNEELFLNRSESFSWITNTNSGIFLGYLILVILVKALATAVTIGSGGAGGTFAPSMFLGGVTGFAFARMINLMGIAHLSESNFALVGMCGVLCGIQYAPLTAIFLIAEITGGYTLFIPLMLVSAITYITVSYFEPDSPYVKELKEIGDYATDHDTKVLDRLNINKLIETDLLEINDQAQLKDLIKLISVSKRNIFPVVDADHKLVGVVTLDHVRDIMFDTEKHNVKISNVMIMPKHFVYYGERMDNVMRKFEKSDNWNLPVVDEDGLYLGFVSKSTIFGVYRKQLIRLNRD